MSRGFLLLLVVGILGTAVATGGVPISDDHDRDRIADDIVLEPSDGPNGAYATVDDGTLSIDLSATSSETAGDGMPANANTGIDDVFTITYTGSERALVWLETDRHALELHTALGAIEGEPNATVLGPDESVSVGFTVDGSSLEPGEEVTGSVEINAKAAESDGNDESSQVPTPSPSPSPDQPPASCHPASIAVDASDETRHVTLADVQTCEPEAIPLQSLPIGDHATLESMVVAVADDGDVAFDVTAQHEETAPKKPVAGLHSETGSVPIGGYTVTGLSADAVDSAEHVVHVDRAWLERDGIDPATITAHRYHGGNWIEVDADGIDETGDAVAIAVAADGAAPYAVGVEAPLVTVENVTVDEATSKTDTKTSATTTVSATVVNRGAVAAAASLELVADGRRLADRSVVLEPNESTVVSFEPALDGSSAEQVALAYSYTGAENSFVVESGQVAGGTVTPSDDGGSGGEGGGGASEPDDTSGPPAASVSASGSGVVFGTILAVGIALLVTVALLRYRLA